MGWLLCDPFFISYFPTEEVTVKLRLKNLLDEEITIEQDSVDILEQEIGLRDETRTLEQARPALEVAKYENQSEPLSQWQKELGEWRKDLGELQKKLLDWQKKLMEWQKELVDVNGKWPKLAGKWQDVMDKAMRELAEKQKARESDAKAYRQIIEEQRRPAEIGLEV